MTRTDQDEEREERFGMRITVDTYTPEEQAMGWYAYLLEPKPHSSTVLSSNHQTGGRSDNQCQVVSLRL
jgi:hypothetical protein